MTASSVEPRLKPQGAADESRFGEKLRDRMRRWRNAVDLLDEHAAWRPPPRAAAADTRARDGAAGLRSLGLGLGQVGDELAIAARQVCRQGAVDENDRSTARSRGSTPRLRGRDIRPRRYSAASPGRIH